AQCNSRFLIMLEQGVLEEVKPLRGLDAALPAMKALGVPELLAYLRGEYSLDQAIAKAQQSTRNYAKRQITWFKHQLPGIKEIGFSRIEEAEEGILKDVKL